MALLIVLTMSHPHVGFYSKINICFYAKFYGQPVAFVFQDFWMRRAKPIQHPAVEAAEAQANRLGVAPSRSRC